MKNIAEIIIYWKELSEYDLLTAEALLKSGRYLYIGFMCHHAIEKIFKGYYPYIIHETPPYTHNPRKLAKMGNFYQDLRDKDKELIDYLEPLNIEARYPTDKARLLKELTHTKCTEIFERNKEFH